MDASHLKTHLPSPAPWSGLIVEVLDQEVFAVITHRMKQLHNSAQCQRRRRGTPVLPTVDGWKRDSDARRELLLRQTEPLAELPDQ